MDNQRWWGNGGLRNSLHEGIDLVLFSTHSNASVYLDEKTNIPAFDRGIFVKSMRDFMGTTIVLLHDHKSYGSKFLVSLYGHTLPLAHLHHGKTVEQGEVIGTIANRRIGSIRSHLHLSLGFIEKNSDYSKLNWDMLHDSGCIELINPISYIGNFQMVDSISHHLKL